jgi:glutathione S-transferase
MQSFPITALATLLISLLQCVIAVNVGRARHRYGVHAPATTGHEMFERAYRVQMNTIEIIVAFLPCLWIFAVFVGDAWAGLAATVFIIGRVLYARGYQREPKQREAGFGIALLAFAVVLLGGAYGVVRVLLAT